MPGIARELMEPAKAIRDMQPLSQDRTEDAAFRLPMLSRAFADYGDLRRARELHEKLVEMSSTNYVGHWNVALSAIGAPVRPDAEATVAIATGGTRRVRPS